MSSGKSKGAWVSPLPPKDHQETHVQLSEVTITFTPCCLTTQQQLEVVDLVMNGKSVFITGCAGTGKSVCLMNPWLFFVDTGQTLMKRLIKLLPRETTFVTASTGIAAIAVGGMYAVVFHSMLTK